MILAERFGGGLDQYAEMDAQKRQHYLNLMGEEAYVANLYAEASEGMSPGDQIFIAELEYDLDDEEDEDA